MAATIGSLACVKLHCVIYSSNGRAGGPEVERFVVTSVRILRRGSVAKN
jgi:hypothetical protein